MRRFLAIVMSAALFITLGCGSRSYEDRLNKTVERMKYEKKLADNLMPPATKGKLETNLIYLRPPKKLEKIADFSLSVLEPGKFDIAETFVEKDVQNLHVLAWIKKIKDPKKKSATETNRGSFNLEVFSVLSSVFSVDIEPTKAKEVVKRGKKYRFLTFDANGKVVQVYLSGSKTTPPEVALIFEYPKAEGMSQKIDLCLESFATGEEARMLFSGGEADETGEPAAPSSAPM